MSRENFNLPAPHPSPYQNKTRTLHLQCLTRSPPTISIPDADSLIPAFAGLIPAAAAMILAHCGPHTPMVKDESASQMPVCLPMFITRCPSTDSSSNIFSVSDQRWVQSSPGSASTSSRTAKTTPNSFDFSLRT